MQVTNPAGAGTGSINLVTGVTTPSYGLAFRVVTMPSDAEATGPAFSSDMGTLFLSVQHPGEDNFSAWP